MRPPTYAVEIVYPDGTTDRRAPYDSAAEAEREAAAQRRTGARARVVMRTAPPRTYAEVRAPEPGATPEESGPVDWDDAFEGWDGT